MYRINYGYGYENRNFKSLSGATRSAMLWCQKAQASAVIGELVSGKMVAVRRVWPFHHEDIL